MSGSIRLLDKSAVLVGSIPADHEDPFSLETFEELIVQHQQVSKQLIIARVKTVDPHLPDKEYFSYYSAHALNKILFRTQIVYGRRLIHRLLVLNPLTNTPIVGDVQYFVVRKNGKSSSIRKRASVDKTTIIQKYSETCVVLETSSECQTVHSADGLESSPGTQTDVQSTRRTSRTEYAGSGVSHINEEALGSVKSPVDSRPAEDYDADLIGTDSHYLDTSACRGLFRENALQPEDAALFEMPPISEQAPGDGSNQEAGFIYLRTVEQRSPGLFSSRFACCSIPMHRLRWYLLILLFLLTAFFFMFYFIRHPSSS